jgi:hypothetical protein
MRIKGIDGHTYCVKIEEGFSPKINGFYGQEIDVIQGYELEKYVETLIANGDERDYKTIYDSIPDSEEIENYETGLFGIEHTFRDDEREVHFVVEVPPAFDHWKYVKKKRI